MELRRGAGPRKYAVESYCREPARQLGFRPRPPGLPASCLQICAGRSRTAVYRQRGFRHSARTHAAGGGGQRHFRLLLPFLRHAALLRCAEVRQFGRAPLPCRSPRPSHGRLCLQRHLRRRHLLGRQGPHPNGSEHDIRTPERQRGGVRGVETAPPRGPRRLAELYPRRRHVLLQLLSALGRHARLRRIV